MRYNVIEIFTSEEARWKGKPVYEAVVEMVRRARIAARCLVTRGIAGCYENGEVASGSLEILSFNMPLKIEIILPEAELAALLPQVEELVVDGAVAVKDMDVRSHKTRKHLVPRQIKVKDVMTSSPRTVTEATPVSEVIQLLLSANFNAVPVVDAANKPVGIITQEDLIQRAGMPIRLGLLSLFRKENIDSYIQSVSHRQAREIMSAPVVTIRDDQRLDEAVKVMLKHNLKRLPVVGTGGDVVGIVARYDVFHTITQETPDWKGLQAQKVKIDNVRVVKDIMQRETRTVLPDASLEEVLEVIDSNEIQRVAVVDKGGCFQGMIFDHDLLGVFAGHHANFWDHIAARLPLKEMAKRHEEIVHLSKSKTASEVMKTDILTVREDTRIDEAVKMMAEKGIKRLPVIGDSGAFKGMVSRDALLRAGQPQVG